MTLRSPPRYRPRWADTGRPPLSLSEKYNKIDDTLWWHYQELIGDVAYATNDVLDAPDTRDITVNGDFASDTIWVKGTGWTIPGGNVAHCDGSQVGTSNLYQLVPAMNGKIWRTTITVSNILAGSVKFVLSGGGLGTPRSTNDTFVEDILAFGTLTNRLHIQADANFIGDVSIVLIQQTNILDDGAFPGAEELDESGASGTATAANWTKASNGKLENLIVGKLRISRDGVNNPGAVQISTVSGVRYVFKATALSDGNASPNVFASILGNIYLGDTSLVQNISVEFVAAGTSITLFSITSTGTEYTEWRNISIRPANPLNAKIVGANIGQPGEGRVKLVYSAEGLAEYVIVDPPTEVNSFFNPDKLTMAIIASSDSWAAGQKVLYRLAVDDNTEAVIYRDGVNIVYDYRVGGNSNAITFDTTTLIGGSPTGLFDLVMTVDTDGAGTVTAYFDGNEVGQLTTITGEWIGNLTIFIVFANSALPDNVYSGDAAHVGLGYGGRVWNLNEIKYYNRCAALPEETGVSGFDNGFDEGFG